MNLNTKGCENAELDSHGSGQGPMAGACEQSKEYSAFEKDSGIS
jgi:hypothetical protein